jgi:heme/copper-type cytochrome/quinol oxidase subunit 2
MKIRLAAIFMSSSRTKKPKEQKEEGHFAVFLALSVLVLFVIGCFTIFSIHNQNGFKKNQS